MPHHLRPSTPYAPDVLLPGDPARALMLAQELLTEPKMSNHARGLWGYSGETPEGRPLSIQSTGMGGPSAAIVLHELSELGVRRAIRVGTCGALDDGLGHGDLVIVGAALAEDGTSRALGADATVEPDPDLTAALTRAAPDGSSPALIVSSDLFYDGPANGATPSDRWRSEGAVAVEMEAATIFTLGRHVGVSAACLLVVSDTFNDGERERIDDDPLTMAAKAMGRAAAAALADAQP